MSIAPDERLLSRYSAGHEARTRHKAVNWEAEMSREVDSLARNGDYCMVIAGTHSGKSGVVQDRKTSKTGHVTITVQQANGVKFKTLARSVEVQPRRDG